MPGACRATGRGLQPSGMRVKQDGDFKVDTKNAGSGELKVVVKGPSECSVWMWLKKLVECAELYVMERSNGSYFQKVDG